MAWECNTSIWGMETGMALGLLVGKSHQNKDVWAQQKPMSQKFIWRAMKKEILSCPAAFIYSGTGKGTGI